MLESSPMQLEYRAQTSTLPFQKGVDIPFDQTRAVYTQLISLGQNIFAESALVKGGPISTGDLNFIWRYFGEVARDNNPVFNESTQQTNMLVGRYTRLLGERFNEAGYNFNLDEMEALGLLHDFGRIMSHRRRINDLYGHSMLRKIGFRPDFLELLPTESRWFPVIRRGDNDQISTFSIDREATRNKYTDIWDYTEVHPTRAVVELADVLGKIDYVNGRIINWSEVVDKALISRQKHPERSTMWGGEYLRQAGVVTQMSEVIEFYERLGNWAEDKLEIPLEEMVSLMTQRLKKSRLRESFATEEKKYAFDVLIFDLGGVLIKGGSVLSNQPILKKLAQDFGLTSIEEKQKLTAELEELIEKMQKGENIEMFGNRRTSSVENAIREVEQGMEVNPQVIDIIKNLAKNGVRIIFASNTVPVSIERMLDLLRAGGLKVEIVDITPNIKKVREDIDKIQKRGSIPVFTSYQLGARKREKSAEDKSKFFDLLKLYANLNGHDILEGRDALVVDDKGDYVKEAQTAGCKNHTFISASELEDFLNAQKSK